MIGGSFSRYSYSEIPSATTIAPITDIVNVTLGSTTAIQNVICPIPQYAAMIHFIQTNQNIADDPKFRQGGNVGLSWGFQTELAIGFGSLYILTWIPKLGKWQINSTS